MVFGNCFRGSTGCLDIVVGMYMKSYTTAARAIPFAWSIPNALVAHLIFGNLYFQIEMDLHWGPVSGVLTRKDAFMRSIEPVVHLVLRLIARQWSVHPYALRTNACQGQEKIYIFSS